jgi:hypothetical protein
MIVVFAFGSSGDILPLLLVSKELIRSSASALSVLFITHLCYEHTIYEQLHDWNISIDSSNGADSSVSSGFCVRYVDTPAVGNKYTSQEEFYGLDSQCPLFEELYQLHNTNISGSSSKIQLIVSNLFSLQGYLLATALKIGCMIVHPHFRPQQQSEQAFRLLLKRSAPALYRRLYERISNNAAELHRRHWHTYLWPLLSSQYDCIRDCLQLPSPLALRSCALPALPLKLFICCSPMLFQTESNDVLSVCGSIDEHSPNGVVSTGADMNIGYHLSPLDQCIQALTALLPSTACSSSSASSSSRSSSSISNLSLRDNTLQCLKFIQAIKNNFVGSVNQRSVVCVDFGSMTSVICDFYLIDRFLRSILDLVLQTDATNNTPYAFVIVSHNCYDLIAERWKSVSSIASADVNTQVLIVNGNVKHSMVLQHCACVVHHGGSGTLHTCLKLGVPQGMSVW